MGGKTLERRIGTGWLEVMGLWRWMEHKVGVLGQAGGWPRTETWRALQSGRAVGSQGGALLWGAGAGFRGKTRPLASRGRPAGGPEMSDVDVAIVRAR